MLSVWVVNNFIYRFVFADFITVNILKADVYEIHVCLDQNRMKRNEIKMPVQLTQIRLENRHFYRSKQNTDNLKIPKKQTNFSHFQMK